MAPRLDLQAALEAKLGSRNVYFQSPPNLQMEYPCIRYELTDIQVKHAGNKPYTIRKRYLVTHIDTNPDSGTPDLIGEMQLCVFDRYYTENNLNHYVYKLFF
jgi:hypothetical protein